MSFPDVGQTWVLEERSYRGEPGYPEMKYHCTCVLTRLDGNMWYGVVVDDSLGEDLGKECKLSRAVDFETSSQERMCWRRIL